MNLLQLVYFQNLAGNEHLIKTAKDLHVSAPAVSVSIHRLEEELGVALFDRVGRNIILNDNGKVFLEYVNTALDAIEAGKKAMRANAEQEDLYIRFSLSDSVFFGGIIEAFMMQHPEITFQQINEDPDESGGLLFAKRLDMMLTPVKIKNSKLSSKVFNEDHYVLVVNQDHPLADKEECSLDDLKDETFICQPQGEQFEQFVAGLFQKYGFEPARIMTFKNPMRIRMIRQGVGIAVTTELALPTSYFRGLRALRIKEFENETYTFSAYWSKEKGLSRSAKAFRNFLYDRLTVDREGLIEKLYERNIYHKTES